MEGASWSVDLKTQRSGVMESERRRLRRSFDVRAGLAAGLLLAAGASRAGVVLGWGSNSLGQLAVPESEAASALAAGSSYGCAIQAGSGAVVCWGAYGAAAAMPPDAVNGMNGTASAIAAGHGYSCAIQAGSGAVVCWGYDGDGQTTVPAAVDGTGGTATAITAGMNHTCAIQAGSGTVVCWGADTYGQATPPASLRASAIAAGGLHTLAIQVPVPEPGASWLALTSFGALLGLRRRRGRAGARRGDVALRQHGFRSRHVRLVHEGVMQPLRLETWVLLALIVPGSPALGAAPLHFLGLGLPPGTDRCSLNTVSSDGSEMVLECSLGGSNPTSFRWDAAHGLQPLDLPPDATECYQLSISGDGAIVAGTCDAPLPTGSEAVRWDATNGAQILGTLPDKPFCEAAGTSTATLSFDGSVVVGDCFTDAGVYEAFRWTATDGMQGLGILADTASSFAIAVSADGSVAVGESDSADFATTKAFRWDAVDGLQDLGSLQGLPNCFSSTVSGDGSHVAGACSDPDAGPEEAFRWDAANGMQGLGLPPDQTETYALHESEDGSIVIGGAYSQTNRVYEAFRWDSGNGITVLAVLPGLDSCEPSSVSRDGSRATGDCYDTAGLVQKAVVWDAQDGIHDLQVDLANQGNDLTDWQLRTSIVSADGGTIAGTGMHMGHYEVWVAPEASAPGTGIAAVASLLALVTRRTRAGLRARSGPPSLSTPPSEEDSRGVASAMSRRAVGRDGERA
jgi:probable HAF family extracellular repeat protein